MFIVLELGSCSLRNIMAMEAHIELPYFLSIATAVCRGVMSIHSQGFIHRDIKPENIISVENFFKITDFGSLQEGTTADGLIGTPLYLAPEMIASA
jgi:serine/threonine-protein kinase